jgi:hypothetical protein
MNAQMALARRASTAEARLDHYFQAGCCSVEAANVVPFLPARREPPDGGRPVLHLAVPARDEPDSGPRMPSSAA